MLCQVWRNIGYCRWEESFEVKYISKDEYMEIILGEEETSDCIIQVEEPVKS